MQPIILELIAAHQHQQGALLPLLHAIQDALGYVPPEAVAPIAKALNLSRAEVHGVITFYHHFRTEPVAPTVVQICRAEACQAMGAERLWEHAQRTARQHSGLTLLPVYCLGLCSTAPSMMVNDQLHARVDCAQWDDLVGAA